MAKQSLVVVESAAKAKTIEKFLGRGFTVRACIVSHRTHRDRVEEAAEIIVRAARELEPAG